MNRAALAITVCSAIAVLTALSVAHATEHVPPSDQKLEPATRYNGSAPIDMKNGMLWNNGTFGVRNPEYESFAAEDTMPGLSAKPYPFAMKESFIEAMNDKIDFSEAAIYNWNHTTEISKPEGIEHAKAAVAAIEPLLAKLKDATKRANDSAEGDWENAQAEARRALGDLYSTYRGMHKNVIR